MSKHCQSEKIFLHHVKKIISGDPKKMDQKLEEQFDRGLEHKLKSGYKGHLGLGFQVFQTKFSGQDTTKLPLFTR